MKTIAFNSSFMLCQTTPCSIIRHPTFSTTVYIADKTPMYITEDTELHTAEIRGYMCSLDFEFYVERDLVERHRMSEIIFKRYKKHDQVNIVENNERPWGRISWGNENSFMNKPFIKKGVSLININEVVDGKQLSRFRGFLEFLDLTSIDEKTAINTFKEELGISGSKINNYGFGFSVLFAFTKKTQSKFLILCLTQRLFDLNQTVVKKN
ncbi:hypothetical protein CDIK_2729 [Cucumispora dikerogammari]|nr:hypothetical protein CDIK_2729 [Cucumispora dikerogammari]